MDFEGINFPVYRKYKNNRSYFKIINPAEFEEVQLIGSRRVVKRIEARLYPERLFVYDLVFNYSAMADEIAGVEYERVRSLPA